MIGLIGGIDTKRVLYYMNYLHPQRLWQLVVNIDVGHFPSCTLLTLRKQIKDSHDSP